jgi:anti-sigma-K factor RskA
MISEEQQDLAALYVLRSLDTNETAEFEAAMRKDTELRALVNSLSESTAAIAFTAPHRQPPPGLKQRVLRDIAVEKSRGASSSGRSISWLPWAIAAALVIFSGFLAYDRAQMRRELEQAKNIDQFAGANFAALAPADGAPPGARAVVAWEPDRQIGVIRISGLPAAGSGKDYQLWAVDEDHKDPVSAGIVRVDPNGAASVRFKPVVEARRVKAFAISLEREGGAPKKEGPILLVGTSS